MSTVIGHITGNKVTVPNNISFFLCERSKLYVMCGDRED